MVISRPSSNMGHVRSLLAVSPEICIASHLYIKCYQIAYWTNNGVVPFSTWKSRFREIGQFKTFLSKTTDLLTIYMSCPARQSTLWTLGNVSTQIILRNPRRLIRADTLRLRRIHVKRNDSWNRKYAGGEKCLSGLACAGCLGWSESILYAESIVLGFSCNTSYIYRNFRPKSEETINCSRGIDAHFRWNWLTSNEQYRSLTT